MGYEVIFTVVEKGLGQEVVDAATKAGSTGATIINARARAYTRTLNSLR